MGLVDDADAHLQREAQRAREREEEARRQVEPFREDWMSELVELLRAHRVPPWPMYVITERRERNSFFFSSMPVHEQVSLWAEGWVLTGYDPSRNDGMGSTFDVILTNDGSMWSPAPTRTQQPHRTATHGFRTEHVLRHILYLDAPKPKRGYGYDSSLREQVGVRVAAALRSGSAI